MNILGLSAFYHDSAACLVQDGRIVAAAQEERFTRKKHDPAFPAHAVDYCLAEAGITAADLDYIAFYDKPLLKFERLLETYLAFAPKGFRSWLTAMPLWVGDKIWMRKNLQRHFAPRDGSGNTSGGGTNAELLFALHHESHAASAFYPSPFAEAAILTVDGVGEWTTASVGIGRGNRIELLEEIRFPHSLGLLYSAFTYFTGFKVNSGEYKLMGLAPYGEPKYADLIRERLFHLDADGSFRLDMDYFDFCTGLTMTNDRFADLFGGPPRRPESPITQREMDLAASVQAVTEDAILAMGRHAHAVTGLPRLCLAGGVALNCVANGRLLREGPFEDLWIQPAAGDAGGALGVALFVWHHYLDHPRDTARLNGRMDLQSGSYLGPAYEDAEIQRVLDDAGAVYTKAASNEELIQETARLLAEEKVVGWFQGRMEFGPRALGNRSILGDPRSPRMQSVMNLKIKYRESFRPFAPSVLRERVTDFFDLDADSPYMLLVADVRAHRLRELSPEERTRTGLDKLKVPRSDIPAVTHVDGSARIQTVHGETNPLYHALLAEFERLTGCPVLINTSFNVRGEPIVCRPEEAWICFRRTRMDALVIGHFLLRKEDQPAFEETTDWQEEFELD